MAAVARRDGPPAFLARRADGAVAACASRGGGDVWRQLDHGVETLRAFHTLWQHLGFHPEGFNLVGMHVQPGQKG